MSQINVGTITEQIVLTPLQTKIFNAATSVLNENATETFRWVSACLGRRSGKTIVNGAIMRQFAVSKPNAKIWYVTDTREHAEDLIWEELKAMIPENWYAKPPENGLLRMKFKNDSEIRLKSADNPDSLVGKGLDLLCIDEAALVKKRAWELMLPTLADKKGSCLLTSTPRGMDNWFYDVHHYAEKMVEEKVPILDEQGFETGEFKSTMVREFPDWINFTATTAEAGIVSPEEIDQQRKIMDPRAFEEEYLASFINMAGRIYHAFDRNDSVREDIYDPGKCPLYIGMDFNVDPMTAVVAIKKDDEIHIVDEIVIRDSNTPEMVTEINNRYKGRNIIVCPDASGSRRDTRSEKRDTSDHKIIKDAGFKVKAAKKNPEVIDRIASVNSMLLNADNKRRMFIHPRCERVIQSLLRHTYKPGTRLPNKDGWDHMNDALGYMVYQLDPINPNKKKVVKSRKLGII